MIHDVNLLFNFGKGSVGIAHRSKSIQASNVSILWYLVNNPTFTDNFELSGNIVDVFIRGNGANLGH